MIAAAQLEAGIAALCLGGAMPCLAVERY